MGWNRESNRLVTVVATVVSFIFVTFLVVGSSRAAFGASTTSDDNRVSAAEVALSHEHRSAVSLSIAGIVPGVTRTHCVDVTYDGTAEDLSPVTLSGVVDAVDRGLEDYLDVTIERISGDCSAPGTVIEVLARSSFATFLDDTATTPMSTAWTPDGDGESSVFRFSFDVADDNDAQGKAVTFDLTWEVHTA
ncbi:MAG: hypothetical protein GX868_01720 [Actinobacteria bacterium]|nr:hypothetical protein [Actinomycetota bacterium]